MFRYSHNPILPTQDENPSEKISEIRTALIAYLNSQCSCNLTSSHVMNEELSCRRGLQDQISYRARILGTNTYSASGLAQLLQLWVETGTASIRVGVSRLEADSSCPVFLDNLNAPDCLPPGTTPQTHTTPQTSTTPQTRTTTQTRTTPQTRPTTTVPVVDRAVGEVSGGEIGGIIVGVLIAVLLLVLAVLLAVHIWRNWNSKKTK